MTDTNEVFAAFVAAQSEFLHVVEDSQVMVGGGSRAGYASLPQVIQSLRPILNKHGLGLLQPAMPHDGGVRVRTMIVHESGQSISDDGITIPAGKLDPQGHGSALSYARRYGLLTMLGVATNDDDGAAALQGIQRQEAARAVAAAIPKLDGKQLACLEAISAAAGHPGKDRSDVPAEDYPKLVEAAINYAVKQGAIAEDAAPEVEQDARALDVDAVKRAVAA